MIVLYWLPTVLSMVVLAAHFLRRGTMDLVVGSVAVLVLLAIRKPWAARALQVILVLAAGEWIRTAWQLASMRAAMGGSMTRLLVILGSVALVAALSALTYETRRMRAWFRFADTRDDSV